MTFSHKLKDYSQKIKQEAQLDLKKFDPSNFLPLWRQAPKREEKREEITRRRCRSQL